MVFLPVAPFTGGMSRVFYGLLCGVSGLLLLWGGGPAMMVVDFYALLLIGWALFALILILPKQRLLRYFALETKTARVLQTLKTKPKHKHHGDQIVSFILLASLAALGLCLFLGYQTWNKPLPFASVFLQAAEHETAPPFLHAPSVALQAKAEFVFLSIAPVLIFYVAGILGLLFSNMQTRVRFVGVWVCLTAAVACGGLGPLFLGHQGAIMGALFYIWLGFCHGYPVLVRRPKTYRLYQT